MTDNARLQPDAGLAQESSGAAREGAGAPGTATVMPEGTGARGAATVMPEGAASLQGGAAPLAAAAGLASDGAASLQANTGHTAQTKWTGTARALLVSVAIGVAGSVLVVPLTYLQLVATLSHVYLVALTLGLWVVPCLLPLALVKKPASAIVACCAIGVISALTTPFGFSAVLALLVEGVIVEIPFAVTLYRSWRVPQYFVAAGLLGAFMGFCVPASLGVADAGLTLQLGCMAIAVISSIAGAALCLAISARVRKTGVLGA